MINVISSAPQAARGRRRRHPGVACGRKDAHLLLPHQHGEAPARDHRRQDQKGDDRASEALSRWRGGPQGAARPPDGIAIWSDLASTAYCGPTGGRSRQALRRSTPSTSTSSRAMSWLLRMLPCGMGSTSPRIASTACSSTGQSSTCSRRASFASCVRRVTGRSCSPSSPTPPGSPTPTGCVLTPKRMKATRSRPTSTSEVPTAPARLAERNVPNETSTLSPLVSSNGGSEGGSSEARAYSTATLGERVCGSGRTRSR